MGSINARTGKPIALAYAHELFGQDRVVVDEAYPGDIVGIVNATDVLVGDTLYLDEPGPVPADPDARARALRHDPQPRPRRAASSFTAA